MKYLILILVVNISYSYDCLNSYIKSPFSKDITSEFGKKIPQYCECSKWAIKDPLEYLFNSKNDMLLKKDYCASKIFNDYEMQLHFTIKFNEFFIPKILSKINTISNPGTAKVVGENKWYSYKECMVNSVTLNCSKINSLTNTNNCIEENFNLDSFYENHRLCTSIKEFVINEGELI